MVNDTDAYRLVHAEGDLLPGLIIDRYGDCFVLQTLTRGMDALKTMWVELLVEEFRPRLIVERNDAKVRQLEGLPMINSLLYTAQGNCIPIDSRPIFSSPRTGSDSGLTCLKGRRRRFPGSARKPRGGYALRARSRA